MLRSGQNCVHSTPAVADSDEALKHFLEDINKRLSTEGPSGVLTLNNPLGVHRVSDISAIDFEDVETPTGTAFGLTKYASGPTQKNG